MLLRRANSPVPRYHFSSLLRPSNTWPVVLNEADIPAMTHLLSNPSLIPLLIGVTGHRDLRQEDINEIEGAVQSVIEGFRRRLPSTPILIVSGLAAGADQLVARVALRCGVDLAAVLPMPVEAYLSTMDNKGQQQFRQLLPQASLVVRLPLDEGVTEALLASCEESRALQYRCLAVFLATHCRAVIALWDGVPSQAMGGTYQVIQYTLRYHPGAADSWSEQQAGIVYHISTPRESNLAVIPAFESECLTSLELASAEDKDRDLEEHRAFETSLEAFNQDVIGQRFLDIGPLCDLVVDHGEKASASFAWRVGKCYNAADELSISFSDRTRNALLWILGFALMAIAGFEIYAHVFPRLFALWLIYPSALVGAWTVHRFTHRARIESKYLDYRALAEVLRVQFFWNLAGIPQSVADHYLVHHRTPLDWIRYGVRGVWLFYLAEAGSCGWEENNLQVVLKHWIRDQKDYYSTTSQTQKDAISDLENWSGWSLRAVWILSLIIPASFLIPWDGLARWRTLATEEPWLGLLILLTTLPSIAIGLVRVWMEQSGYEQQVRTYNRMAHVFKGAVDRLSAVLAEHNANGQESRVESSREVIHGLGIEALEENGDWLLLHRERPLKVVGG